MAEAPEPKYKSDQPAIRTMRSDIAEFLKSRKSSLLSIFGQGVKKEESPTATPESFLSRRLVILASAAGFLIFAGLAIFLIGRFWPSGTPSDEFESSQSLSPPSFFFENTSVLTVANQSSAIRQALERLTTQTDAPDSMRRIVFQIKSGDGMTRAMSAKDFFEILRVSPPPEFLANSTGPLEFFAAWPANGPSLGLLTETRNPQRAFQGLLKWETAMAGDLEILFLGRAPGSSFEAFKDYTYRNIDFRFLVLEGADKGIGYLVFPAKRTVVISTSFEAMRQVIQRLLEAR